MSAYTYPIACTVSHQEDLENGEEIAECPSCSLIVKVIYNPEDFQPQENVQSSKLLKMTS